MSRLYGPGPEDPPRLIPSTDLAGLSTNDVEDRPVGELFGALAEERSGLIRYLDVALRGANRHVLVPIGHSRVERESVPPRVRLRAATYEDLCSVPEYDPDATTVDGGYQERLMQAHGLMFYGSRYYAHPAYDHRGVYEREAPLSGPAAGVAEPRLRSLGELKDYRIVSGEVDIREWPLEDARGEQVGTITDLLVERSARKVRYVVVELSGVGRPAAVPLGYLQIDRHAGRVWTPTLERDDLRLLPPYEPPLDRESENRIRATIEGRLIGSRYFLRPDFRPV
jgi:hypothetical protein